MKMKPLRVRMMYAAVRKLQKRPNVMDCWQLVEKEGSTCVCDRDLVSATQQDDIAAPDTYYWPGPPLLDLMSSVIMTITRGAP